MIFLNHKKIGFDPWGTKPFLFLYPVDTRSPGRILFNCECAFELFQAQESKKLRIYIKFSAEAAKRADESENLPFFSGVAFFESRIESGNKHRLVASGASLSNRPHSPASKERNWSGSYEYMNTGHGTSMTGEEGYVLLYYS